MSPLKEYSSLEEVADLLGVTYQLVYRLVREGELPAIRLGRVYRVAKTDLEAYLESRKPVKTVGVGSVCANCGRRYSSRLSFAGECADCGAAICRDCWERVGVRKCAEHTGSPPAAAAPKG